MSTPRIRRTIQPPDNFDSSINTAIANILSVLSNLRAEVADLRDLHVEIANI